MKIYETIISLAPAIIISSIGGLANYIYKTRNGTTWVIISSGFGSIDFTVLGAFSVGPGGIQYDIVFIK